MATKLYIANDSSGVFSPATWKGTWDATTFATTGRLHTSRCGAGTSNFVTETSTTNPTKRPVHRAVSDPIKSNQTIDGTFNAILLMRENNALANMSAIIHIWVTTGDTDTVRGTLLSNYIDSAEFIVSGTQFGAITISPQSLSSVSAQAGDRIVIEIGYNAANSDTTSYQGALKLGGDQTDADGSETADGGGTIAAWTNFSVDIVFKPSYLYLTNSAAPVTPAAVRGTWDATGSSVDKSLGQTRSGASTSQLVSETSTSQQDVLIYRGVSDQIAAQTVSGDLQAIIKIVEGAGTADAFAKLHVYVMASDGSVRGTLLSNSVVGTELPTSNIAYKTFTLSSVSAQDTDRIVVEVGARFTNVTATSQTASVFYGCTNADANDGSSVIDTDLSGWVRFTNGLTYYAAPTGFPHSQVAGVIG